MSRIKDFKDIVKWAYRFSFVALIGILGLLGIAIILLAYVTIRSNVLFAFIFVGIGLYSLYMSYRGFKIFKDFKSEEIIFGAAKDFYARRKKEIIVTVVLLLWVSILMVTGSFTFLDNYVDIPKIQYNFLLWMAFFLPIVVLETLVYQISIFFIHSLHLSPIVIFLEGILIFLEIFYLYQISRLILWVYDIIIKSGKNH